MASPATVRVKRGARWLDENFPGWEKRINPKTLRLDDASSCICGQVFKGKKRGMSGFGYAESTLFSEANAWINGIVKMQTKSQGLSANDMWLRIDRVSVALGFDTGVVIGDGDEDKPSAASDAEEVSYPELQSAWEKLLANRSVTKDAG